jgi:hypothetical protein
MKFLANSSKTFFPKEINLLAETGVNISAHQEIRNA